MAAPATFRIKGLRQLDRALGKADKNLRKNLRGELKEIAEVVARRARGIAEAKGLRDTGDLIRGIKPYALTGRAGVRSNAVHRGFAYPARLEFEGRGAGGWGPRATLNPAVDQTRHEIERGIEQLLDRMETDFRGPTL